MAKHTLNDVFDLILNNDHRTISKVISKIEFDLDINNELHNKLYPHTKNCIKIGITGPPGAGKSTLTDKLIDKYLSDNKSVGVIAVDPSSPFSGGALLGDRVRMNNYLWNENVFIRSMGSQGNLGGLNNKSQDAADILAASGKDIVIYETVGVGQGEHDISKAADLTIVILVPESGDDVQLMKAGLIEIADLFVVNKSDRDGSDRLVQSINNVLQIFKNKDKHEPPVFKTSADRGEGIQSLYKGINNLLNDRDRTGLLKQKKIERYKDRVLNLVQNTLINNFWTNSKIDKLESMISKLQTSETAPYETAKSILKSNHE
jgi:LAO/AO transport system kinase|tara:strand:+ start:63 stop:1016 length:954 start_codon:yes stop_codon:yes gene_type:complete